MSGPRSARDLPTGVRRCKGTLQIGYAPAPGKPWRWESVAKALGTTPAEVTPQDAVKLRIRRLAAVQEGRYVNPEVSKVTVRDVLLNYAEALLARGNECKTLWLARPDAAGLGRYGGDRGYRLRCIADTLGDMLVKDVTTFVIRQWANSLRHHHEYAAATVHTTAWVLWTAINRARRDTLLGPQFVMPDMPELERGKPRTARLETAAVAAILRVLDPTMNRIIRLVYLTGRRGKECRTVRCEYVNLRGRVLVLPDTKTGEGFAIPLTGELWTVIEEAWAAREYPRRDGTTAISEWLFHEQGKPLCRDAYHDRWRAACATAGVVGALPHDLRRTFVHDGLEASMDEKTILELGGWKSRSVFDTHYNNARTLERLGVAHASLQAHRQRQLDTDLLRSERK